MKNATIKYFIYKFIIHIVAILHFTVIYVLFNDNLSFDTCVVNQIVTIRFAFSIFCLTFCKKNDKSLISD